MDDDLDTVDFLEVVAVGVMGWVLVPLVVGRLADANISSSAGAWTRPTVMIAILIWSAYRPAAPALKLTLLLAIDLMLKLGLLASIVASAIAVVIASFDLSVLPRVFWLLPFAAAGLGVVRSVLTSWLRRDRRRQVTADSSR